MLFDNICAFSLRKDLLHKQYEIKSLDTFSPDVPTWLESTCSATEKRDYTASELILGNAGVIAWIVLGSVAGSLFNFFVGLGFFALMAFLVYYRIGEKGCNHAFTAKRAQ